MWSGSLNHVQSLQAALAQMGGGQKLDPKCWVASLAVHFSSLWGGVGGGFNLELNLMVYVRFVLVVTRHGIVQMFMHIHWVFRPKRSYLKRFRAPLCMVPEPRL